MLFCICILAFAICKSLAMNATAYNPLPLAFNKNASERIANYPFYIQAFPYDFNCSGTVSFIKNPPPVDGQGTYSYMENVSSILTVPADNTSVTCIYTAEKPICYAGDSPKCFSMSNTINKVDVQMNDSSHILDANNGSYVPYTESYYIITPETTYAYVEEGPEKPKHDPYAIYRSYLYPCDGNQTCMFDYLSAGLTRDKQRCGSGYSIKEKYFENKEKFMDYFNTQREKTARNTSLAFIPPKLQPVSDRQAVSQIDLESSTEFASFSESKDCISTSPSTSIRLTNRSLHVCLAFGLIMLSFL
ncbi:hypothetical protein SPOG_04978 [Schizosaccharomyces cryophilus OY26]|uniref:Uncharacterized protein n=1 Tax=Schizosaccharomyces cryophilus (strain OY26 / ATCC MYA-4695 / CBS 11777 / NBRC 106824 / NRRL Y48691) TaxID=653667 RepID=S9W2J3_SCHCR|nr:uncharacterized protein SPOG_04978 [Schizosaccharomyces cryophilus OY26]EPY52250.1 hypothetical protein SPOG_04978 [Schizosaccharomyces cryophilus OY26]